ncbi:acetate kinase [Subsaximicrobium wynnwilliamsii]|uniref:Acetate kinase n=1 Tax=Subsaximicrobium wynnwilliamsii TaxID=291179 RepID=A0A5C6ZLL9_9FLAO|nr:acetate kinase [Subsaximicrobium wynnwilliamsii]TXD84450.1 acetate kinase [Subsaximicrobium wynnwilliamsii]TXD90131.1 acetate kinase [Subsaximicrobium wynnwilliamsii]TXE04183.1 acetate kinase [Subsaximicrobium wynnwilliamsii]
MNILVINSGSSSIKFQLIQMPSEALICSGLVERIGHKDAILNYTRSNTSIQQIGRIETHQEALHKILDLLLDAETGVIQKSNEIEVVGHRVVHGGNSFSETALITAEVKQEIQQYAALAPLHNPSNLVGILVAEAFFPLARQVAVFDTAFHQSIPEKAKKYAIPNNFYEDHGIQLYGFHGTSHQYVSEQAIAYLQLQRSKIISIHLGNGCSITAIMDGKSIDHSMGFSPSPGLIMGTRSGDIDHSIVFHLVNNLGYSLNEVDKLLNKKSGMLGLTGYSDLRDIQAEAEKGNAHCVLALAMNAYRIKKYIGAYIAAMNGLDAIVFTAGIGENSSTLRQLICADMDCFNIALDDSKNEFRTQNIREIHTDASKVKILVVPTNEELEIAKQAFQLVH